MSLTETYSFLCVSMRLALNNLLWRVVAYSDIKAITSGNRMSLTGDNGLGYSERQDLRSLTIW